MPSYNVTPYGSHWLLTIGDIRQTFVAQSDAEEEGKRLVERAVHPPIAWVRVTTTGLYPIPHGAQPTTCASCGASIVWARTPTGAPIPLSLATARAVGERRMAESHFVDCIDAEAWSGKART